MLESHSEGAHLLNRPKSVEQKSASKGGGTLVLWLIVLSLSGFFAPLYLVATTVQNQTLILATEQVNLSATLALTPPPNPTEEALRGEFSQLQLQINALAALDTTLSGTHLDVPQVMSTIGSYNQAQITLTSISQIDRDLTLHGEAISEPVVLIYVDMLKETGLFQQVTIQTIQRKAEPANGSQTPAAPTDKNTEFTLLVQVKGGQNDG